MILNHRESGERKRQGTSKFISFYKGFLSYRPLMLIMEILGQIMLWQTCHWRASCCTRKLGNFVFSFIIAADNQQGLVVCVENKDISIYFVLFSTACFLPKVSLQVLRYFC